MKTGFMFANLMTLQKQQRRKWFSAAFFEWCLNERKRTDQHYLILLPSFHAFPTFFSIFM